MTGAAPDATVVLAGRLWAEPGRGPVTRDAALHIADGCIERVASAAQTAASRRLPAVPAGLNAPDHGNRFRPIACCPPDPSLARWIPRLRALPPPHP